MLCFMTPLGGILVLLGVVVLISACYLVWTYVPTGEVCPSCFGSDYSETGVGTVRCNQCGMEFLGPKENL